MKSPNYNNLLITGDYPYYRDNMDNWEQKICLSKELGLNVLTFYIPWRHHCIYDNGKIIYDFDGLKQKNTNVKKFISIIKKYNMECIIKPGPFVHAELINGGLPDFVMPQNNMEIENIVYCSGKTKSYMGKDLPNPLSPIYISYVKSWFNALWEAVIKDNSYPLGPIIGIQISNEGIYGEANSKMVEFDNSSLAINYFNNFMCNKLNLNINCTDFKAYLTDMKSSDVFNLCEWLIEYRNSHIVNYSNLLPENKIPIYININAPEKRRNNENIDTSIDNWLARNYSKSLSNINYSFTNWLGNALFDKDSFEKLIFVSKINKWPNIESNWGHTWASKEYEKVSISLYHLAIMLSCGVVGFNIYNICTTECKDSNLLFDERTIELFAENKELYDEVYCKGALISKKGNKNHNYDEAKNFIKYLNNHNDIVKCVAKADFYIAVYNKYMWLTSLSSCMNKNDKVYFEKCNSEMNFMKLHNKSIDNNIAFDFLDLDEDINQCNKDIIFYSLYLLGKEVQQKLINYVKDGGNLILYGEIPIYDENGERCEDLKNFYLDTIVNPDNTKGSILFVDENNIECTIDNKLSKYNSNITNNIYNNDVFYSILYFENIQYHFIINRCNDNKLFNLNIYERPLSISLSKYGFAILKTSNEEFVDIYIKNNDSFSNNNGIFKFNNIFLKYNMGEDIYYERE